MDSMKIISMIDKLISVSEDKMLNWRITADIDEYEVALNNYSVRVSEGESEFGHVHNIYIIDDTGLIIDDVTNDIDRSIMNVRELNDKLKRLYGLARSQARGVDEAVNSILNQLNSLDFPSEEEDLPF